MTTVNQRVNSTAEESVPVAALCSCPSCRKNWEEYKKASYRKSTKSFTEWEKNFRYATVAGIVKEG